MSPPPGDSRPARDVRGAGAAAALLLYAVLFFAPATLLGGQFFFRDVSQNHYPVRCFEFPAACGADSGSGVLPLWNPHLTFGQPAWANPNFLVLHPTTLLFFVLPFDAAFRWGIVLQFALAAVGTYLLLRDLGAGRPAAWLAGVAFAFSGPAASLGNLYNLLASAAWMPLSLFLLRRAVGGGFGWAAGAAAALAVQIIAGEPLMVVATLVLGTALTLAPPPTSRADGRGRRVAGLAVVLALGAGMAAVQILPALELLPHSDRGAGFSPAEAMRWSVHPLRGLEMLVAGWFGDPAAMRPESWWGEGFFESSLPLLLGGYVGIPVLLLALLAGVVARRDRVVGVLAAGAAASLLLALGRHVGLFALLRFIPFLDQVRYPSKFLVVFAFCLACLAGLGAQRLRDGIVPRGIVAAGVALTCVPAALAVVLAVPGAGSALLHGPLRALGDPGDGRDALVLPQMSMAALQATVVAGAACLLLWAARGRLRPRAAALALAALVAADLYAANAGLNPTVDASWYQARPRLLEDLRAIDPAGRLYRPPRPAGFALKVDPNADAAAAGFLWDRMSFRNLTGLPYGLNLAFDRNTEGLNPRASAVAARDLEDALDLPSRLPLWRVGATRFVLAYGPLDHPDLALVRQAGGAASHPLALYELRLPLARARLVGRWEHAPDLAHGLARLGADGFDPSTTVLLPGAGAGSGGSAWSAPAEILRDEPRSVEIATAATADAVLVLADSWYPGWRAELDGRAVEIEPVYHMFRAVRVPAGEHRVVFRYEPRSLRAGTLISVATLLLSVAGAWLGMRRPIVA